MVSVNNVAAATTQWLSLQHSGCCYNTLAVATTHWLPQEESGCRYNTVTAATTQWSGANQCGCNFNPLRSGATRAGGLHKLSTQNLTQLSTALTGGVALVNVQCFKCLGLTFR
ncbi:hypothetical protein OTU49_014816 [Cherax quadricarinatus]|uniref:Uncharacterized protein n=1 Tax=Cherax quadricarinatus TaxID=27406 RepID=A0AAW0Y0V1_CHEQU